MTIGEGGFYELDEPADQLKTPPKPPSPGDMKRHAINGVRSEASVDKVTAAIPQEAAGKTVVDNVRDAIPERYDADEGKRAPTICVVPRDIAEGRKDAYEPAVVCIGPSFGREARQDESRGKLERYKWCCARRLIVNAGMGLGRGGCAASSWIPAVHEPLLLKCLRSMKGLEQHICATYGSTDAAKTWGMTSDDLALLMLLDGCFVLHRLLKFARLLRGEAEDDDDWTQTFGRRGIWTVVTRDLLLLKNQIPFLVVRELFKHLKVCAREREDDVLIAGGLRLFASLRPGQAVSSAASAGGGRTISCRDVHHLLHLLYLSIDVVAHQHAQAHEIIVPLELEGWVPCAKELEEAGVTLRARKQSAAMARQKQQYGFLDVSFCRGVLEIPPLELFDHSETLFRNLIAFEQTYPHAAGHVTAYAIFMDCLVKTADDVRLLHQRGVLVSRINGDRDDVATGFFSRICAQVHISRDQNYLAGVMGDVVRYQGKRCPRWRAELVRNYFRDPWVTTALLVAFAILVMTFLQTFFTVYAYFKQPS